MSASGRTEGLPPFRVAVAEPLLKMCLFRFGRCASAKDEPATLGSNQTILRNGTILGSKNVNLF